MLIVVNVLCIILISAGLIMKKDYARAIYAKDEYKYIYGLSLWIEEKLKLSASGGKKLWDIMDQISCHANPDKELKKYYCKKIYLCIIVLLIANFFSLMVGIQAKTGNQEENVVIRPEYGEGEKEVVSKVIIDGKEEEITYKISERVPDDKECEDAFSRTMKYIDENFLGENESVDCVNKKLNFFERCEEENVDITWIPDEDGYVDSNGEVERIFNSEGIVVEIMAVMSYMGEEKDYIIPIRIIPDDNELSKAEKLAMTIETLDKSDPNSESFILPEEIDGTEVDYIKKEGNDALLMMILGFVTMFSTFVLGDKKLKEKSEKRNQQMMIDFPEIMCKFTVLLKAGLTIKGAFIKIAKDYKKSGRTRYAYEEMVYTCNEMDSGIPEFRAYENYGNRCQVMPYGKFATWIIQQGRKGNGGLIDLLELQMFEATKERNKIIRINGERISTRLLIPMTGLLGIVIAVVVVPAFMGL